MSESPRYLVNFNRAQVSPSKAKFQREERTPPGLRAHSGLVLHDLGKPSPLVN